ncbi:MAG: DUF5706 domain-containing protein [Saprospiraceae bacterium]|nr:DUF5706 domain-containing protein [Saprospiraceae bacterium]
MYFYKMETNEVCIETKPKKSKKISKDVLNIIRTTMRNNIELTHIADNKANVLLSLNALMITFLVPFVVPNFESIKEFNLVFPLGLIVITAFVTIYISTLVLKPSKFNQNKKLLEEGKYVSPFFFGNFFQMNKSEFSTYIKGALSDNDLIKEHLTEDLHYIGSRLGRKMTLVRLAFNVFIIGFFSSISLAIFMIFTLN